MFLSLKIYIKSYLIRKAILLFFFSFLTNHLFSQDYNYRNFNTDDGLAHSFVYSIIQDNRGYLWIGTGGGLSRFNGFKFEYYSTNDSLADNFITCGISDQEYLWFGHNNGRLTYFNGKKFQAVDIPETNLSPVTHFVKSTDGQIWVSTYSDGLLKLERETDEIKKYRYNDQVFIISFDFLSDTELLVGTNTGLLYCKLKEPGEIEIIQTVADIPESKVTCIQKMRNKSGFYIATQNDGIFQLTYENKLFKILKIITDPDFDFTGIQDIIEDNLANLWLASFGDGLIKTYYSESGKLTKIKSFNNTNGFTTDNVKTLFEDREGNIWSGNYGEGLTQIIPKTFSVLTFDNPLYGNDIFSFYFNRQYRWTGTGNGLVKMDVLTGKIIRFYSQGSGLPKDTITSIYSADGKELWIGTEKNGLFRMEVSNEKILKYPLSEGVLENSITFITGKGEQIWIGTKKGLCNINISTGKANWYSINQGGLPHNYINCLFIDRTDRLWVTTSSNTLSYIQNEKVNKIPFSGRLTFGPITEDSDARIWVGTIGNGIFTLESDSIKNITVKEGLLSDFCYSLICDDNKNIWVGHKGGLSRIGADDFSLKAYNQIEGKTDSYKFNANAITKDQQKIIWFGSSEGMVAYDPSVKYPKSIPPVLGITSITINDEERDYSDIMVLSPGKYKIRIEFLGVSLKEPSLVTYQHKLEGFDQWSEITRNTSITYYNLTEGDYTFILKAASEDGAVSENPLTINIIIKIPLWKKWWFYVITILFLFILTFIYIKRREYKYLAEKNVLEEKVRERTYEIQCQKNEIELQRDVIDKKNANITSSIEYASHIQQTVLPPMELINKLLPDNFILNKPKDIVSGDFYWLTEKDNKIVFTVADCTGHGVPGAFMSLLGITLLNEIVNLQGITRSDAIVTQLRERVIHSLQQGRENISTSDGMDLVLCVLDQHQKRIQYTGGMNDLVYIRDGNLVKVKADRFSVCASLDYYFPFTMKEVEYRNGDVFYLFSDGYQDQFGGENDKKYLVPNFHTTLLEIHKLPMLEQKEILDKKLKDWMKDSIQTDDITVMGIRL